MERGGEEGIDRCAPYARCSRITPYNSRARDSVGMSIARACIDSRCFVPSCMPVVENGIPGEK